MKSRFLRSLLSIILIFSTLLFTACEAPPSDKPDPDVPPDPPVENVYTPILRFAVTSDIHLRAGEDDMKSGEMLKGFINGAYSYADGESYKGLDGLFFVGDSTNGGTRDEQTKFFNIVNSLVREGTIARAVTGNHEFYAWNESGEATYAQSAIDRAMDKFLEFSGYESANAHYEIGGYHFILISIDTYVSAEKKYVSDATLAWVKEKLELAVADDPTGKKPIFVFQHNPPLNSEVAGFGGGDKKLSEMLKDYPQVIDFAGHTHRSVLSPSQIWQDGFTAIGTGGLAYLGLTIAGHPDYSTDSVIATDKYGSYTNHGYENQERNGGLFYIIEVDENNVVRALHYNIYTNSVFGEPYVFEVGDPYKFKYLPNMEIDSVPPSFSEGASITVEKNSPNYTVIKFPQASGPDGIDSYRIDIYKGDTLVKEIYRIAGEHYGDAMPKTAITPITGLKPSTTYNLEIYPINRYGIRGRPLKVSFTTSENTLVPDILKTEFNTGGTAINGATGEELLTVGNPEVKYDEALGKNYVSVTGEDGYIFEDIERWYNSARYGVTVEACFRLTALDGAMSIGANTNAAGYGISVTADGRYRFAYRSRTNSTDQYYIAESEAGVAQLGEWVHVVGVYVSSKVYLYVNGEVLSTVKTNGLFHEPTGDATAFVVGGDISKDGTLESGATADILALNIYTRALSIEEINELFSANLS